MAISKLEIQKQILKEANARANKLVEEILKQADRNNTVVDPSSMDAINSIIADIEGRGFNGNVDLLKEAVAVYENAIKSIDEQLKSEEAKEFSDDEKKSLEDAKKLLETQSKNGRVGTILDKVEELTEAELSSDIEKRYNDDKLRTINAEINEKKQEEESKYGTFDSILIKTKENREQVEKLQTIINKIEKLKDEKKKLEDELSKASDDDEKEKIGKEIKAKDEEIKSVAEEAKENKDDKTYELQKDEKIEDYTNRVLMQIKSRNDVFNDKSIEDLKAIKDLEVDLGDKKVKVEEYLKEFLDKRKSIADLSEKISIDKKVLARRIARSDEHKKIEELETEKEKYEKRNENISKTSKENNEHITSMYNQEENSLTKYEKGGWFKRKFNKFKNWFKRKWNGEEVGQDGASNENTKKIDIQKKMLEEVEKSVDSKVASRDFKKHFKVDEKDMISAEVETKINKQREAVYKKRYEDNEQEQ